MLEPGAGRAITATGYAAVNGMSTRLAALRALERGIEFVVARQGNDGLWRDFLTPAGAASEWPTGFIGIALHSAGADASALRKAAGALIETQDADGGWGYNENAPSDADSTGCVLLFLSHMGYRGNERERAASFLGRHQRSESGGIATFHEPGPIRKFMGVGRWMRFTGWCHPHTEVTAMAGRALAAMDPKHSSPALHAAWRYVRSRQCTDGSWMSYWWASPHYATLQAVELALSMGDEHCARLAGEWALRSQAAEGGWGMAAAPISAFATALGLSILVNAGAGQEQIERAVLRLSALQDVDGGWPSHPMLRIPLPRVVDPDRRPRWPLGTGGGGIVIPDQHRTFTSAVCVAALAGAREAVE